MEEKYKIEEDTRRALLRHSGNTTKVSEDMCRPLEYVKKIQAKMKKDLKKNPGTNLQIATNITNMIVEGRQRRQQVYQDMQDNLMDRGQIMACPVCKTEVGDYNESSQTYYCPVCVAHITPRILDRDIVYARIQLIQEALLNEDDKLMSWVAKMGWNGQEAPVGPTTVIHNKQQVLVVGGDKKAELGDKEKKVLEEIRHLPALEAEKLRNDLKDEIINIDGQIRDAEEDNATEETEGSS